jgi:hypothetical protein
MMLVSTTGNTASRPLPYDPMRKLNVTTIPTKIATTRLLSRHSRVPERPNNPNSDGYGGCVNQERRTERPVASRYYCRQRNPDAIGATKADGERSLLSKHAVHHRENNIRRIDGEARHRALRDEMCVVVEGQKNIYRPRPDRQRRDQTADQRASTFGRDCRRHHKSGGYGHFDDERERKIKIGRHLGRRTRSRRRAQRKLQPCMAGR